MSIIRDSRIATPLMPYSLRVATEAAARAAYDWIGRGDRAQGDAAAILAMEAELTRLPMTGMIVIGEGKREECSSLYTGQDLGGAEGAGDWDVVVDPIEGTSYLMRGMTNAMACIAIAPRGSLFQPGPAFYMEKFAGPPATRGRIDPEAPVEDKLRALSECLNKPVEDLSIYVLEKPRHRELVERLHAAGARVMLYPAGDVAGAIMAAIPDSGIDALMGTGGVPEGMLSACAIRALGGEFIARLDPQLATERMAVEAAGLSTSRWYALNELVASDQVYFCATGITTGLLFDGIERGRHHEKTQTLMIGGNAGERQVLTSYHRRTPAAAAASRT
jgi:fructose-1,6-bisphosphatase II